MRISNCRRGPYVPFRRAPQRCCSGSQSLDVDETGESDEDFIVNLTAVNEMIGISSQEAKLLSERILPKWAVGKSNVSRVWNVLCEAFEKYPMRVILADTATDTLAEVLPQTAQPTSVRPLGDLFQPL